MKSFHRARVARRQRGSVTVEMLLLAPVIFLIGLFSLQIGRWSGAHLDVQHAADAGARAASMVAASRMAGEARSAVRADLANRGSQCLSPTISMSQVVSNGMRAVRVRVSCVVNQNGTVVLGMSSKTVTAESVEYIDVFTYR